MIKKIGISEEDKKSILSHEYPKDSNLGGIDFAGVVVNKPWGYEYLMFQTPEVSIWMLYIKKGHSTSMHCHPKKKTSLLLILGEAKCSTLNEKFILKEKEGVIYDRGVFHTTEAISENGIFIMEIETPTDKTDLFRLRDNYQREMKAYTDKKNITKKTYNYHYLFLDNNKQDSIDTLGKYKYLIKSFDNNDSFLENVKDAEADIGILLSGEIQVGGEKFIQGDIVEMERLKISKIDTPVKFLLINERKDLEKLSDFVISFLQKKGVNDVFLVSGGNLMHLTESIRVKKMNYLCNHHEQAVAMAAEAYARVTGKTGFAMVTSGPGGTNAITGVVGAWIDSTPLLVISGQSYDSQTVGNSGLRQLGVQEINILDIVKPLIIYPILEFGADGANSDKSSICLL